MFEPVGVVSGFTHMIVSGKKPGVGLVMSNTRVLTFMFDEFSVDEPINLAKSCF